MARNLMGIAKKAGGLVMIELLVPGGTLMVVALLLAGVSLPAMPREVATLLPALKAAKRLQ